MDNKTLLPLLVAVGALGLSIFAMIQGQPETGSLNSDQQALVEGNQKQLIALREEIENISRRLDSLSQRPAGLDASTVQRMIEKAARGTDMVGTGETSALMEGAQEEKPVSESGEGLNFDATMAQLVADPSNWEGRQAIWAKLRKAGKLDEAIAWLEERARASANDPEAHCDLAEAYIAKIQVAGNDFALLSSLSQKADKEFDRVLEIDDHHWRGRLQKAISLSFWPPIMGKQGEAIRQFEILAEQQKSKPPQKNFATTYMFLGNMYAQQGKMKKARAAWQQGLAVDPDNQNLQNALKKSGGQ